MGWFRRAKPSPVFCSECEWERDDERCAKKFRDREFLDRDEPRIHQWCLVGNRRGNCAQFKTKVSE